ncbi:MAG: M48 family metalloprotease [Acidobacteria bacterium]|nr:M48 family metalloprotease [Acidobacteriota bacterium]MBI3661771.1 M48 family metalloprotease [Acidobacteriota bacterium]
MKRWLAFGCVVLLVAAALAWSEVRKAHAPVDTRAVLYFLADTERELGRLPFGLTRLSNEEEIAIGNELAGYDTRGFSGAQPQDAEVAAIVERVGQQIAVRAHRKLPYTFHYIPDLRLANAFALPGGHIFIGAGLIAMMDTEDQLAAVLGHEIAHVDRFHCAERFQVEARLRKLNLGVVGALANLPLTIFQAGYSKTQELEADRVGTELAVRASYSPLGAVGLFEKFAALDRGESPRAGSPQAEVLRVTLGTLTGYFRSHPAPNERIAQIQRLIAEHNWEQLTREKTLASRPAPPPKPAP